MVYVVDGSNSFPNLPKTQHYILKVTAKDTMDTQTTQGSAARLLADQSQGQYKSRIPMSYDKAAEAGLEGYPAAKVRNTNREIEHQSFKLTASRSILTTCLPVTRTRSTLH